MAANGRHICFLGISAQKDISMLTHAILSFGLGVDSSAVLLRWIFEPERAPAHWENITCVPGHDRNRIPMTPPAM